MQVESIYYNGDIITMKNKGDMAEAVLIDDGIIKAVGSFNKDRKSVV